MPIIYNISQFQDLLPLSAHNNVQLIALAVWHVIIISLEHTSHKLSSSGKTHKKTFVTHIKSFFFIVLFC